jgi:class 3 adenylate cyclase
MFDERIDLYDVYKVATIGDAYLVVGGAPERAIDHAYQVCRLAVDIRRTVADFIIAHLPMHKFQQRVGLHSGQYKIEHWNRKEKSEITLTR